jgi:DNA-binding NarL/FixJ family response regulator
VIAEKIKVLIIDDHEVVREGLATVINSQPNLTVIGQASTATAGFVAVGKNKPDVILIDVSIPGENVFEHIKEYKKGSPNVRILFLSAYSTDANVEKAIKAGGAGFITKSEPSLTIVAALTDVASGKSYFSQDVTNRLVINSGSQANMSETLVKGELLSPREIEVLCSVGRGLTAKEIATQLNISSKTVERHKSNIMAKLGIHNQVELTRYAIREGLLTP